MILSHEIFKAVVLTGCISLWHENSPVIRFAHVLVVCYEIPVVTDALGGFFHDGGAFVVCTTGYPCKGVLVEIDRDGTRGGLKPFADYGEPKYTVAGVDSELSTMEDVLDENQDGSAGTGIGVAVILLESYQLVKMVVPVVLADFEFLVSVPDVGEVWVLAFEFDDVGSHDDHLFSLRRFSDREQ